MMFPMKYAAQFINGCAFKPEDWGNDGLPIVRIAQLSGGEFDNYFLGDVDKRHQIGNGDLLFAWSATLDSFIWKRGPAYLNQHTFKVVPRPGNDRGFLYYSLKHYAPLWADNDAHGSTTRHIKRESLGNKVWLPDPETQKAIARYLDRETARIDQLIAKKERQAEVLADKKTSIVRDLAQNGTRPGAVRKSTGDRWLPTVPQHWEPLRIRYLFRAAKRQGMPELDVLSVYRDYGVILKSSRDDNINRTPDDLSSYQLVEPGDLVINKMKAWQGSLGIAPIRGITSPDYLVYQPVRPMVGRFIHHYLRAQPMPSLFLSISNGIRTDQWRLEHSKFIDVVVWLPPLDEQAEIAAAIDARTTRLDPLIDAVSNSIERLKEHRAALITAAVTGQIDVRNYV